MLIGRLYFVTRGFYMALLTLSSNVGVLQWASRQDLFMLLSLLLVSWKCNLLGGRWQLWTFPVRLWVSRMSVSGPSSYCAHKDKRWTTGESPGARVSGVSGPRPSMQPDVWESPFITSDSAHRGHRYKTPHAGGLVEAKIDFKVSWGLFLANLSVALLTGKCSGVHMWKPNIAAEWELSVSGNRWRIP